MMLYELDEIELEALMGATVAMARTALNDGRPLTEVSARPGERIQTFWCEGCKDWHTGSVLGGPIGDPHGETRASCDACGELKPQAGFKSAFVYGTEGSFCHDCRHGKGCDCGADDA